MTFRNSVGEIYSWPEIANIQITGVSSCFWGKIGHNVKESKMSIKKILNLFVFPNKDYVVSSAVWIDTMDQLKRSSATQEDINYLYLALW